MIFTAINIGPIIRTLGMARRPREFWAASYMFSYLAKCIYEELENKACEVISPAKPEKDTGKVGIYPDRLFVKGQVDSDNILSEACWRFYSDLLGTSSKTSNNPDMHYFNIMSASCDAEKESEALAILNQKLDLMELCGFATDRDAAQDISDIIVKKKNSSLFTLATGEDHFPIPELEDIARTELKHHSEIKEKSHHKYFCVVQADGDNVGKTVSHKALKDGQIKKISEALVRFGQGAAGIIEEFGGLPIYAGGDDLLFIAPVIGNDGTNIFDLLNKIENEAFGGVVEAVDDCCLTYENKPVKASLSFGVAISYYKYPLYEAFESARNLLFGKAKSFPKKKAVAWSFRKHSGGTFEAAFSLSDTELQAAFNNMIVNTSEKTVVSAVAHKIRQQETLVKTVMDAEKSIKVGEPRHRLNALFEKVLEFQDNDYFNSIKRLMPLLYKEVGKDKFISTLYSLLRTAKFIKGEDLRDE